MNHNTPAGYEEKFADLIRMCAELKAKGLTEMVVAYPWALGDTYKEVIESLSRVADAGLSLHIVAPKDSPSRN
jgi:hypothetical protein